jgi:hypothetical protein
MIGRLLVAGLFWAVAAPFVYEGIAIATRGEPTISRIVAYSIDTHPVLAVPAAFALGGVLTLLVMHFAGVLPWWRP